MRIGDLACAPPSFCTLSGQFFFTSAITKTIREAAPRNFVQLLAVLTHSEVVLNWFLFTLKMFDIFGFMLMYKCACRELDVKVNTSVLTVDYSQSINQAEATHWLA